MKSRDKPLTTTKKERLTKLAAKLKAKLAAGKGGHKRAFFKAKIAAIEARIAEM